MPSPTTSRLSFSSSMPNPPRNPTGSGSGPRTGSSPSSSPTSSRRRSFRRDSLSSPTSPTGTGFTAASSIGSDFDDEADDEEWEGGERLQGRRRGGRKRDEPMSPALVVFYVTAVYLIFQILTRSDDNEILSHLPSTSSILSSSAALPGMSSTRHHDSSSYSLPYHLPHIPSPIPPAGTASSPGGFWTVLMGVAIYPFYLLITLLATPFPLILNVLHLLVDIISTLLYPITSTLRLFTRTFLLAPMGILRQVLAALYPVYVFVAGVVGVGLAMGVGAGWAGSALTQALFGKKKSARSGAGKARPKGLRVKTASEKSGSGSTRSSRKSKPTGEASREKDKERDQRESTSEEGWNVNLKTPEPVLHPSREYASAMAKDGKGIGATGSVRERYGEKAIGVRRRVSHLGEGR